MKLIIAIFCGLLAFANASAAEISDADFKKAFEKYIATEEGQAKVGSAMKAYMQKQQAEAQKAAKEKQKAQLEEQFKKPVDVPVGKAPTKGPENAKVTVVEFSDFECPYCKRGADTVEQILKAYPNDVRVAFKNLPLPFHKNAGLIAEKM